ncbi:MAG: M20/M25/M40 family metallo-hydrolase [Oscillospiraceae bacterium]|nr:M20/M25/M40 family metallo-hydrolase [Oscillospiraceae bacterium]
MIELLKDLCALPGVTGQEDAVRDYIKNIAEGLADEVSVDRLGNVLAYRAGHEDGAGTVMLCAHMDEVGLLIRAVTDDGFLKFVCAGGIDRRVLIGQRVFIGNEKIPGIIGLKAKHLSNAEEQKKLPKLEDMYIDAGFADREEAEKAVELGDFAAFDHRQVEFGDGMLKAKALDDRVGCTALLKLMEKRYARNVWYVFSVQEEAGLRGAYAAAYKLAGDSRKPDMALAVEGTTAADMPGLPGHRQVCRPGGGVVIPFMDGGTVYDREIGQTLKGIAEKLGYKWQTKEYVSGGTDAAAIQRTREGIRVAGIALAVRYIHTPISCVKLEELGQMIEILGEFLSINN